jgi:hypothetical protein
MFERCISPHCFSNGQILGLKVEIRADLLETSLTCAETPRLKQAFSKNFHTTPNHQEG